MSTRNMDVLDNVKKDSHCGKNIEQADNQRAYLFSCPNVCKGNYYALRMRKVFFRYLPERFIYILLSIVFLSDL